MPGAAQPIRSWTEGPEPSGSWWRVVRDQLAQAEPYDLASQLTLLLVLLYPPPVWWANIAALFVVAGGLLAPALTRRAGYWFVVAAIIASWVIPDWTTIDNHGFLLAYWCLALACSIRFGRDRNATLAANARWLLGLVFLLATLWKVVLSPDFTNGVFLRATLLGDPRFRELSLLAGGMTPASYAHNEEVFTELMAGRGGATSATLVEPHRQAALALAMTWWTVVVEGSLALLFLVPRRWRITRWRDPLLVYFSICTYPFANVAGFGWLLSILGVAQLEPERRLMRGVYLVAFALVLVDIVVPWTTMLARWLVG